MLRTTAAHPCDRSLNVGPGALPDAAEAILETLPMGAPSEWDK